MRFQTLTHEAELIAYQQAFLAGYQRRSDKKGSELPLAYLQACTVVGLFDQKNQMVAGYVLGTAMPLRLLNFVPEAERSKLTVPFELQWADCCEITCAWRLPEVSLLYMSSRFWPHALLGVLKSGRKLLLGHNQSAKLDKFYTTLGPVTIYQGVSAFGLPSRLFAYSRSRVIVSILGFWVFETPRRFLRSFFRSETPEA